MFVILALLLAWPQAPAQNTLGVELSKEKRYAEAEAAFRSAIASDAKFTKAYLNLALLLLASGRAGEAEQTALEATRHNPSDPEPWTLVGTARSYLGKPDAAEAFRRAVALDPSSIDARLNLGLALIDGRIGEALAVFTDAVRMAPGSAAAHYNRGRVLIDLSQLEEARQELDTALRLRPGHAHTLLLLALAEQRLGNPARAITLIKQLQAIDPNDFKAWHLLGEALDAAGRPAEAIAAWKEALRLEPSHQPSLYRLSRALAETDPAQAAAYEREFIRLRDAETARESVVGLLRSAQQALRDGDPNLALRRVGQGLESCGQCALRGELEWLRAEIAQGRQATVPDTKEKDAVSNSARPHAGSGNSCVPFLPQR